MQNLHKKGVVVGRFQPFHNGHLAYVRLALEQCDELYIGVTTPGKTATKYEPANKERFGKSNNPFTYEERVAMMRLALKDTGEDLHRIHFVHFNPSDIKAWHNAVPKDAVYFLLLLTKSEENKVAEMRAQGLKVQVLAIKYRREHAAQDIRERIKTGKDWQHLVPTAVAAYLCKNKLLLEKMRTL